MRLLWLALVCLLTAAPDVAFAQIKLQSRAAPGGSEIRYFTAIDGLMDGNADVILKETRQGRAVTAAVLDICYPLDRVSGRRDRFVVDLAISGRTMTGTTQSMGEKSPVSVKLTRKPTGDTVDFHGQISIGQKVTEVASSDNTDISAQEFQDSQSGDDTITEAPRDFTEVSPESIAVRVKLDSVLDFLKGLKGQDVEVGLSSLSVTCDALRSGEQTVSISVDPARAAALIAKARTMPGVTAAGWTTGIVEMDRAIRFPAADWRDGDKIDRNKLADAISAVLARTLAASPTASAWSPTTGKLKLTFKRPSPLFPALNLTDTIEVTGLVSPDRPGGSDRLMLWIGSPVTTTTDESTGAKLVLSDDSSVDDEGGDRDDTGSIDALTKALKGQRWNVDKSVWK